MSVALFYFICKSETGAIFVQRAVTVWPLAVTHILECLEIGSLTAKPYAFIC